MKTVEVLLRVTYDPGAEAAYVHLTDNSADGGVACTALMDDPDLVMASTWTWTTLVRSLASSC